MHTVNLNNEGESTMPNTPEVLVIPENANEPYTDDEIRLILGSPPTDAQVSILAGVLKRTPSAIRMIQKFAFSGNWMKKTLADKCSNSVGNNVHQRIARIKRELGIHIGHRPS
jgi:hypothetical protein